MIYFAGKVLEEWLRNFANKWRILDTTVLDHNLVERVISKYLPGQVRYAEAFFEKETPTTEELLDHVLKTDMIFHIENMQG